MGLEDSSDIRKIFLPLAAAPGCILDGPNLPAQNIIDCRDGYVKS